jgi:gliding motility-associated-like protein
VSPAVFTVTPGYSRPPLTGTFRWQTDCADISDQYYSVVFKATDSLTANGTQLSDLKTVQIKVVGPPPEGLVVTAEAGKTTISWDKPYFCENARGKYFYGFSVWRREGNNPFVPDTCTPGLAGRGYTEIAFRVTRMQNGRYIFEDTKVERGRTYCYRVMAKFARISPGGYPYNLVEGLPSKEVCVQLPRDLPIMTNVSVRTTGVTNGEIEVVWTKPVAKDLDTLLNPGPYRYQLLRATGAGTPSAFTEVVGASFVRNRFWQANDTSFIDRSLNTESNQYHYKVAFYAASKPDPLGFSNEASSVFLTAGATDQASELTWIQRVPWANFRYIIYRKNLAGGFDSIGVSTTPRYTDRGLVNGQRYCYKIRTIGTYAIQGVRSPLLNHSQEACNIPIDTIPPCVPTLTVKNLCQDRQSGTVAGPPYENKLEWTNSNTCPGADDTDSYKVWYAPTPNAPFVVLETLNGANKTTYTHTLDNNLAGCYAVSATDTAGNESRRSNVVCVDNCPDYLLPNAFTPNGDGHNDVYTPFPGWRFIEKIELQILNIWGNVVFTTEDPAINWNGTTSDGKEASDGTYYYVCRVFERRVEGIVARPDALRGYIELVR